MNYVMVKQALLKVAPSLVLHCAALLSEILPFHQIEISEVISSSSALHVMQAGLPFP